MAFQESPQAQAQPQACSPSMPPSSPSLPVIVPMCRSSVLLSSSSLWVSMSDTSLIFKHVRRSVASLRSVSSLILASLSELEESSSRSTDFTLVSNVLLDELDDSDDYDDDDNVLNDDNDGNHGAANAAHHADRSNDAHNEDAVVPKDELEEDASASASSSASSQQSQLQSETNHNTETSFTHNARTNKVQSHRKHDRKRWLATFQHPRTSQNRETTTVVATLGCYEIMAQENNALFQVKVGVVLDDDGERRPRVVHNVEPPTTSTATARTMGDVALLATLADRLENAQVCAEGLCLPRAVQLLQAHGKHRGAQSLLTLCLPNVEDAQSGPTVDTVALRTKIGELAEAQGKFELAIGVYDSICRIAETMPGAVVDRDKAWTKMRVAKSQMFRRDNSRGGSVDT